MYFEGRELNPYAEPVCCGRLGEGETYFMVTLVDEDMLVPSVEPVVYIGHNLEAGDKGKVYFQDAESYLAGERYDGAENGSGQIYSGAETELSHIFEYERGLDILLSCALRRKKDMK